MPLYPPLVSSVFCNREMKSLNDISKCLLDHDGSARDITFTPVKIGDLISFVNAISKEYALREGHYFEGDNEGVSLVTESIGTCLQKSNGSIYSYWLSTSHMISQLQIFIYWPQDEGKYFLELTFFPQDIVQNKYDANNFIQIIAKWADALSAENYFVRYENASWKEYDETSPDVIFTKKTMQNQ